MSTSSGFRLAPTLILALTSLAGAQKSLLPESAQALVLAGSIPLPNVQGRIDHPAADSKGRLFVSALGNDKGEVLDLSAGRRVHSISAVPSPQGLVYAPELNNLFVGSDKGKLPIYDAVSLDLITSIDFGDDVDKPSLFAFGPKFLPPSVRVGRVLGKASSGTRGAQCRGVDLYRAELHKTELHKTKKDEWHETRDCRLTGETF